MESVGCEFEGFIGGFIYLVRVIILVYVDVYGNTYNIRGYFRVGGGKGYVLSLIRFVFFWCFFVFGFVFVCFVN